MISKNDKFKRFNNYEKIPSLLLSAVFSILLVFSLSGFGNSDSGTVTIAIPNDTTNEARALLLLEELGCIRLKDGAGITATPLDVEENPGKIKFREVEAAQIPNVLKDVDYAVISD